MPALLSADQADLVPMLLLGVGFIVVGFMVFRVWPRVAFAVWLVSVALVPMWMGITAVFYWMPATAVGLLLVAAMFDRSPWRFSRADWLVLVLFAVSLSSLAVPGGWTLTGIFALITHWMLGFLIGRMVLRRIPLDWVLRATTVVFAAVAALAIFEFIFSWNPFILMPGKAPYYEYWSVLQSRGSVVRSEGAWGHSIALGCALAMSIPLALGSSFSLRVRILVLAVLVGGVAVSFSRAAIMGAILAILLSMYALPDLSRRVRQAVTASMLVVGVALLPLLAGVYSEAEEGLQISSSYRLELLNLVGAMEPVGLSGLAERNVSGELVFGGFRSIDNGLLLMGLTYGWIPLAIAIGLLIAAVVMVLRRTAEPPTLAVVSQIPAIATVALITQFGIYFWFVVGLAVAAQAQRWAWPPDDAARTTSIAGHSDDVAQVRTGSR